MGKSLEEHLTKWKCKIAKRERCSASLVTREMQIKTTTRYHYKPTAGQKLKSLTTANVSKMYGNTELAIHWMYTECTFYIHTAGPSVNSSALCRTDRDCEGKRKQTHSTEAIDPALAYSATLPCLPRGFDRLTHEKEKTGEGHTHKSKEIRKCRLSVRKGK